MENRGIISSFKWFIGGVLVDKLRKNITIYDPTSNSLTTHSRLSSSHCSIVWCTSFVSYCLKAGNNLILVAKLRPKYIGLQSKEPQVTDSVEKLELGLIWEQLK